jgi:6-phosphofructokinase 2
MPKILTLTMNPAVDMSTSTERVEPTRKLRCHSGRQDPGGGGVNVARVARRLGAEVTAIYPAGGLVGKLLTELIDQEGLESIVVPVQGETRVDFTVMDENSAQQYRFVMPGPHLHGAEWMRCLEVFAGFKASPDIVCASGSLPPGVPADFYARVGGIVSSWGVRFALDSSGVALKRALDHPIFVLKPSIGELRELTGASLDSEAAMAAACKAVIESTRVQNIALTLGSEGALLVSPRRVLKAKALPIRPHSAVGAGDSFLGAMVWALACDKPIEEAFRFGVAGGSAALLAAGTELCRASDTLRLFEQAAVQDITAQAA